MGFPYHAGDTVLIGITISRSFELNGEDRWEPSRYFVEAEVIANDREAGRLVLKYEDGRYDWSVWSREEGGFCGEEIVKNKPVYTKQFGTVSYPRTPDEAWRMVAEGSHPDLLCSLGCGRPAKYIKDGDYDESNVLYCTECSSETCASLTPVVSAWREKKNRYGSTITPIVS